MKKRHSLARLPLLTIGFILFTGVLFTACKKSNDNSGNNTPVAGLMAFNLAPDKPSIGISLSGSNLTQTPLAYAGFTGSYLPIYTGSRNVASFDNNSTPLSSDSITFEANKYYSLFVVGINGSYKNLIVNDNFDSLSSTSDQAFIRYINAIPDSSKPSVNITAGGNSIINSSAGFPAVSAFVPVTAGDVNVALTNESTINLNRTITLEQKKIYTILLIGNPAATDSTAKPQIRFIQNGSL